MTLSLSAVDTTTGALGIVIASSSPAVASRCIHLRAGVGAVASQNVTDPSLGPAVLDALAAGRPPIAAVEQVLDQDPFRQHRQVAAVDIHGRTFVHSGEAALGIHGEAVGIGAIAAGNLLHDDTVLPAMLRGFEDASGPFERRLLAALRSAVDAGGEAGPVRSAGIGVTERATWRVTDLRVDDHDDPVAELERLLELWLPQKADYLRRALDPTGAPSYGVPGDQ